MRDAAPEAGLPLLDDFNDLSRPEGAAYVPACRMGPEGDPGAVVDGAGRVRGVENLHVCDASIMPSIPRANTNLTTVAIAERIAELIAS